MKTTTSPLWKNLVRGTAILAFAPALFALTPQETVSLQYMRQEEKLARDVYQALALRWDHPTFVRIAASEQRHMDALANLLQRHAVADDTPAEPGRFTIPELQTLHDTLVAEGQASIEAALQVGITIEETDIADLKEAMTATQATDLLRVFGQLNAASERHLNAFTVALQDPTATTPACSGRGTGPCPAGGTCPQGGRGKGMGKGAGKAPGTACGLGGGQGPRRGGAGANGTCTQRQAAMGGEGTGGTGTCPNLNAETVVPPAVTPPASSAPRARNGQR